MADTLAPASFVENVNTVANATVLATGDIIEDAQIARDEAVAAAENAKDSAIEADSSEELAHAWATKQYNNPVQNGEFSSYHWSIIAQENAGDELIDDNLTSVNTTWSSQKISDTSQTKSDVNHLHTGVYEPAIGVKGSAFNKNYDGSGSATTTARSDHSHSGVYEPVITTKGTAFNKNFGLVAGSVAEGDHSHTDDYMPKATINTAYNKNFVVDSNSPLSTEIPRGNHVHAASGITYDNTDNTVISSSTVQGGLNQLDAALGVLSVAERTNISAGMTNPTHIVPITATGVGSEIITAMTIGPGQKNATYSGGGMIINYDEDPDKLIEGWFSTTVSMLVESNIQYAMAIWVNGVIIDSSFRSQLGSASNNTEGDFAFSIDGFISGLANGSTISVALYNETNTDDITVYAHTISWAGAPEGALVASGVSVDHSDLTGTGAANGIHTTSDIQDLDTQLLAKADKVIGAVADNLVTLDADGNIVDSGHPVSEITAYMNLAPAPVLDNIVTMSSSGDSLNSGAKITDFALVGGSSAQLFNVQAGLSGTDAVNFTQLDAVSTVVDGAIPKVTTPTTGNFPVMDANGELDTSVFNETSFATASHGHAISDTTGLQDELDDKYDGVVGAATDNIPVFANGQTLVDSGTSIADLNVDAKVDKAGDTMTGNLEAPSMSLGGNYISPFAMRNKLINGEVTRINQRGFSGSWVNGQYGYDRWKATATAMVQIIEDGNYTPSVEHTLSGNGVTTQQLTSPASGDWTIPGVPRTATKIQLEEGAVATPFEVRPYGMELSLCQRYYERVVAGSNYGAFGLCVITSATVGKLSVPFKVTKRIVPEIGNGGNMQVYDGNNHPITNIANSSSTINVADLTIISLGLIPRSAGLVNAAVDPSAYLEFDAEL